ncbi:MAG: histidine kinase dimerization/phospho-acceptor domain-containing protein, partial [Mycobacteriales bacterium]
MSGADRSPSPEHTQLRVLVGAVSVVGLVALVVAGWELVDSSTHMGPRLVLVVAAIVLVGDVSLLRIRFGANGNSFNWAEAALIVGATVGGWPLLLVVGTFTILVHQLLIRRPLRKCVFSAATFAVGGWLARLTFGAVTGSWTEMPNGDLSLLGAAGLAAGAAVSFLWISTAVVFAVAWSQGLPVRQVWAKGAALRLLVSLGNIIAGVAAVLIGHWNSPALLVLPFFLLAGYYVYRNYLNAQQERERWQDLQGATLQLQQVDSGEVTAAVQRGAEVLFGADCTMLLLADDPQVTATTPAVLALGLSAIEPVIVKTKDAPPDVRRELEALGVIEGVLAPLAGLGRGAGVLLVGFSGPAHVKPRELQVISTFANHASVSMQRARLFGEIDEQRGRLSAVIDNASDGVVLVSADGVVASWNPGMARLTGRKEEDVLGQPLDAAFAGECADGTPFVVAEALQRLDDADSPEHLTLDIKLETPDASIREASLSLSAVRAPSGICEYAVLVARDITATREVQQAKQDFIATVSHELRTPLTPIKGYLSLFLRSDFHMDDTKRRVIFAQMLDRANQLERLVEDLLSTSRMEHGEFSLRPEPTDVEGVVA